MNYPQSVAPLWAPCEDCGAISTGATGGGAIAKVDLGAIAKVDFGRSEDGTYGIGSSKMARRNRSRVEMDPY
jgi:hypothetical protein